MRKIRSKDIDLTNLKVVVTYETDYLLDPEQQREFSGFMKKCIKDGNFPGTIQYLLFSATFSEEVADIIESYIELTLKTENIMLDCVNHYFIPSTAKS
jgi:superfamily II DNA/RNA helicase